MARDPLADVLTVERIVAVDPPREHRLHPRERLVAYTAPIAGTRQVLLLSLRGGAPVQLTAGEKPASDPRWSPDGRRLAFVRDGGIVVLELDGSRETVVSHHPAGEESPRWSPDGSRLAFVSRRRGWSSIWLVDAPVPRRGRPRKDPKAAVPRQVTGSGIDISSIDWSPDGSRIAFTASPPEPTSREEVWVTDLEGKVTRVGNGSAWESGVAWLDERTLLFASDADGWFQVVRTAIDGRDRVALTAGPRDRSGLGSSVGFDPLPSPDGSRFTHPEFHDGLVDLIVAPNSAATPVKRGPGRPPKNPRPVEGSGGGVRINPDDGVWRAVGWLPDGSAVLATGENGSRPNDLWLLPVPGVAAEGARPRQLTDSLPAVLRPAFTGGRAIEGERISFAARDGLRVHATLFRPPEASGRRGARKVPTLVLAHGGPTAQALRGWAPFKQLLAREGYAVLDVDFRGSTGYGSAFRDANHGVWGVADAQDLVDAARWATGQAWSDGRLGVYGGSYGGYLVLCALTEEPALWSAGVDWFGDSDIAESYRRGDRPGRLDLHRMMGSPDDPAAAERYRLGSPVFRAERIEAPLLILHGRKDRRVVPLMSERMVEALEIESKHHEVVWFDDEGHGWENPANRRAAYRKTLEFLRRHLADEGD